MADPLTEQYLADRDVFSELTRDLDKFVRELDFGMWNPDRVASINFMKEMTPVVERLNAVLKSAK